MTAAVASSSPEPRCAAPGCANPVVRRHRRGRPPRYCSPACRRRAARPCVELDHTDTAEQHRPQGRVWRVRLHYRGRSLIVADGLGRPSAESLAHQLASLFTPSRARRLPPPPSPGDPR